MISFTPYLPLTYTCSFDCIFCSENRCGCWKNKHNTDIIIDNNVYFKKVEQYLDSHSDIFLSLSGLNITDCVNTTKRIIKLREKYKSNISEAILYTNGNNLIECEDIILASDVGIELSYMSYDDDIRLKITRPKKTYNFDIKALKHKKHILLNSIIHKSIIYSINKVNEYVDKSSQFKAIKFREYAYKGKHDDKIFKDILNRSNVLDSKVGYYYTSYDCGNYYLETSNYEKMELEMNLDSKIKNILFPNGNLCNSWEYNKNILV